MNVLVIGCGNLGSRLADTLCHHGHYVSVIDINAESFDLLDEDFDGMTVAGMPMDMTVLRSAGVEGCDAVAVVTSDDNLNITVSQIVREFFGIENVVARITNPAREKVFKDFGLKTVSQTKLSCRAIFSALTSRWKEEQISIGASTIAFKLKEVESILIGRSLNTVPVKPGEIIMGVLDKDGNVELYDGRQKIVLNPTDMIIYNKVVD